MAAIYLTVKQASEQLERKAVSTIRDHIHAGRLPAIRVGRIWLITQEDMDIFKKKYPYLYRIHNTGETSV